MSPGLLLLTSFTIGFLHVSLARRVEAVQTNDRTIMARHVDFILGYRFLSRSLIFDFSLANISMRSVLRNGACRSMAFHAFSIHAAFLLREGKFIEKVEDVPDKSPESDVVPSVTDTEPVNDPVETGEY